MSLSSPTFFPDEFLKQPPSFRNHRFLSGWTGFGPDVKLITHGAYSEPFLCSAQEYGEGMLQFAFCQELAVNGHHRAFTSCMDSRELSESLSLAMS